MLRLMLMRHAKSAPQEPGLSDFDRPLNPKGRKSSIAMGTFMAERGMAPARILCSSAQRSRETLALLLPHLAADLDLCIARRLYHADGQGYLEAMRDYGATEPSLLVIGHNPAIQDIAQILAPLGDAPGLRAIKEKYPTGGVAVVDFDAPRWADIGPGAGRLISFHTPRSIGGED